MSSEENKTVACRFLHAWSAGGLSIVDELASPDISVSYAHFRQPYSGIENYKKLLTHTTTCFPDLEITVDEVISEGDRVAIRWTYVATHQHGELYGVQPSKKRVRVSGVTFYRVRNGKVLEESGVVDALGLMQQLHEPAHPPVDKHQTN